MVIKYYFPVLEKLHCLHVDLLIGNLQGRVHSTLGDLGDRSVSTGLNGGLSKSTVTVKSVASR